MGLAPLLIVGSHALAIVTVLMNYIKLQLKMKVAYNIFNKTKPLPFMIEKKSRLECEKMILLAV